MRLLLDTHTLIWALSEPERVNEKVASMIQNVNNVVFVSVASLWELQIKKALNKIQLPQEFVDQIKENGYELLNINYEHVSILDSLPMLHRDPFDRMLIAQSICESIPLVTRDSEIAKYDIKVIIP